LLHEYHVYSVCYYPWFHITVVGLGMYYMWIWEPTCVGNTVTLLER
jgi:hypothetical protein